PPALPHFSPLSLHDALPIYDRAKVNQLLSHGARLATDDDARGDFAELGHRVSYTTEEAIERATIVVDCTPAGNENKAKYYELTRSEEHTSELQSRSDLVCRL